MSHRLSTLQRLWLTTIGVLGVTLLLIAGSLEPDSRGFGTHEQLGLMPCYFQELTGKVCPMCGGTTAWAYVLRGELVLAASANLGGMLLCMVVVIGSPWLLFVAIRGQWSAVWPTWRVPLLMASVWLAVVVFDWLRKFLA